MRVPLPLSLERKTSSKKTGLLLAIEGEGEKLVPSESKIKSSYSMSPMKNSKRFETFKKSTMVVMEIEDLTKDANVLALTYQCYGSVQVLHHVLPPPTIHHAKVVARLDPL